MPESLAKGANGDGRVNGRFVKGWKGGPGNPHAKRVAQLRARIMQAVDDETFDEVITALIQMAKDKDLDAIRELLDRSIGKASQTEMIERVERLEQLLEERVRESQLQT